MSIPRKKADMLPCLGFGSKIEQPIAKEPEGKDKIYKSILKMVKDYQNVINLDGETEHLAHRLTTFMFNKKFPAPEAKEGEAIPEEVKAWVNEMALKLTAVIYDDPFVTYQTGAEDGATAMYKAKQFEIQYREEEIARLREEAQAYRNTLERYAGTEMTQLAKEVLAKYPTNKPTQE